MSRSITLLAQSMGLLSSGFPTIRPLVAADEAIELNQ
jgi:hypothetical protein